MILQDALDDIALAATDGVVKNVELPPISWSARTDSVGYWALIKWDLIGEGIIGARGQATLFSDIESPVAETEVWMRGEIPVEQPTNIEQRITRRIVLLIQQSRIDGGQIDGAKWIGGSREVNILRNGVVTLHYVSTSNSGVKSVPPMSFAVMS